MMSHPPVLTQPATLQSCLAGAQHSWALRSDTGLAPSKAGAICSQGAISSIKDTSHLHQQSWAPKSHRAAQQWAQGAHSDIPACLSPLETGAWPQESSLSGCTVRPSAHLRCFSAQKSSERAEDAPLATTANPTLWQSLNCHIKFQGLVLCLYSSRNPRFSPKSS